MTTPLLNTLSYDVVFDDGEVKEYSANVIAENMFSQVDQDGYHVQMLDSIVDHASEDDAVRKENQYITTRSGTKRLRKSTRGWNLLVKWQHGGEQWIPLSILKESKPVKVAEYAEARSLSDEPAFKFWVPYTLRKRDTIISAVTARLKKTTHKYGIRIPRTIEKAFEIDAENGNHEWRDAI